MSILTWLPQVGECVEAKHPGCELGDWEIVKVVDTNAGIRIAVRDMNDELWWAWTFRPIDTRPQQVYNLLELWKRQGIDFAHDNLDSKYTLEQIFTFIAKIRSTKIEELHHGNSESV